MLGFCCYGVFIWMISQFGAKIYASTKK